MTAPLALGLFTLLMATVGSRWLQRARWPERSPRLGIVAWQVAATATLMSVVLAGLALAVPTLPATINLADFLHMCALALREQYSTPGGLATSLAGLALAMAVTARMGWCLLAAVTVTRRCRRGQRESLRLVARRDAEHGVLVVEHATPAVYCLPGQRGEVVVTSAALHALDEEQTEAVLAHERAHLRARHDLLLAVAEAASRAFPKVPVFARARVELGRLVEMHADDVAAGRGTRLALAAAVVRLAGGPSPTGTLGAGVESVQARVRRLIDAPRPLGRVGVALTWVGLVATISAPLVVVAAPAALAAAADLCPLGFPT
ncbi:MAG: M56 family metallopeptidase [Pseudonocardiaceae bacterium]